MTSDIHLSLAQIHSLLISREKSVEEVTQACLDRIIATEPTINAFITICAEEALNEAKKLDQSTPDPKKPLWGIPIAIKDNILTKNIPTTAASCMLKHFIPQYDAFIIQQLKNAGAIIIGKTNLDEFAMGSSTETSSFGPTYNPWNTKCVPGGSSGGSAASVAAFQCFSAIGTDTGGSIRQPAALCGCIGLKPTYGRVSRYGIIAYASSLDQAGPITRTVEDAAIMLSVLAKHDPQDTTSSYKATENYCINLKKQDLTGITIGIPKEFISEHIDPPILNIYQQAIEQAKELGAKIIDLSLPHATDHAIATYYIIATAEAASNLARFDGVRYGYRAKNSHTLEELYINSRTKGFGEEVKRRILLGTHVLSTDYYENYYHKAAQIRYLILQDFLSAFKQCDILLTPVSPITAWEVGSTIKKPITIYHKDIFTVSLNLAGLPGLSIPAGLVKGLPVGIQLIGQAFEESTLLSIGNILHKYLGPTSQPNL